MALSHEVGGIRGLIQKIEHPRAWQADRNTPIALFERNVVAHALRETRSHGLVSPIMTLLFDQPFGIAKIDDGKSLYVMEDEAYASLESEGGREPDKFSWVPEEGMSIGNGKRLETSIHANRRNPSVVYVERDAFDQEGKRYMRTVSVAPRTQRYDELLANPIKSDKDEELSTYVTPLKRPSSGEVIEVDFQ